MLLKYYHWVNTGQLERDLLAGPRGYSPRPPVAHKLDSYKLHYMLGNVWELVEDCRNNNYRGAPLDGRAWTEDGDCEKRTLRGGSWANEPEIFRIAFRNWTLKEFRSSGTGFRVARTLRR